MKNFRKYLAITLVVGITSFSANAQFIKKIKNAANRGMQNAVEKKVEEQTNKMVQRQLEKQFEKIFGEYREADAVGIDMSKIMKGLGEDVPTAEVYEFSGNTVLDIITTDEKGKVSDPMQIKSFLTTSNEYTGMEVSGTEKKQSLATMIFDMSHQASIILMDNDGQKSSIAYRLDLNAMVDSTYDKTVEQQIEEQDVTFEKTGNTKDILGYSCEEFHVKSEDGEGNYWMTNEPIGGYSSIWGANSPFMTDKNKAKYADTFKNLPQGNFMEMTYNSTDGTIVEMNVTEINESAPISFQMSAYPTIFKTAQANQ
jgi:hypothetical protein